MLTMLQAVYYARNGNPDRAYQIFVNLIQDARVPRQTLAFSYHALILFGPSRSMSQINLDHCRAVAQTLIDEKVRDSLIISLDDLQIEVDQMEEGIWRSMIWRSRDMEEQALSTTVKQEERSSVATEMQRADETDGAATALPDDDRSSPPFSAPGIEAEVDFVAKNHVYEV